MFLEVHVLQNFALSNLNRDDTGAPKTCDFGGTRRARISSQCLKRAVRTYFREESAVRSDELSYRTKLVKDALASRIANMGADAPDALAAAAVAHLGLGLKKEKTEYLLFVGAAELDALAALAVENASALSGEKKVDKAVQTAMLRALDGGGAVDLALFGRMIADRPEKNVDAAVQMAHAFSTHAVSTEFDFYSAVDDLQREDDEAGMGAGMLGTTLYNSSCYYRYSNLDARQLKANLGAHASRGADAVRAFLAGVVHAVPSGKQSGSAAQNPPGCVLVVVRERGLWSLANAFVRAVRPRGNDDVVHLSAGALLAHFQQLAGLYGTAGISYAGLATYLDPLEVAAPLRRVPSVVDLVDGAVAALGPVEGWA